MAGIYIAQADIEDVFGKDNVATWSNLDGEAGADTTRINSAIEWAEEEVQNRFREGRYKLPFSPIPKVLKYWCAALAGLWLFENRPGYKYTKEQLEGFNLVRERVDKDIDSYNSGQRVLDCELAHSDAADAPQVVD